MTHLSREQRGDSDQLYFVEKNNTNIDKFESTKRRKRNAPRNKFLVFKPNTILK